MVSILSWSSEFEQSTASFIFKKGFYALGLEYARALIIKQLCIKQYYYD